jgi:hypothetical protein
MPPACPVETYVESYKASDQNFEDAAVRGTQTNDLETYVVVSSTQGPNYRLIPVVT